MHIKSTAVRRSILASLVILACASLLPWPAQAFCGFFVSGADAALSNNASQVVLLRKGNHTAMTLGNNYKGPPQDFAMVVPVPVVLKKEQVKTLKPEVLERVDKLSAPRLVEYWEQDPCYVPPPEEEMDEAKAAPRKMMSAKKKSAGALGVTIEAQFTVGEYEILILSAKESSGLETWLRQNRYKIPKGAAAALAPYVRDQMKFFVAKVDIKKVVRDSHGLVVLSPLRFDFDSQELRLPVRLGLLNADGKQDLIIYVLHPSKRFEVANYRNVFIPTNIEVSNDVRKSFPGFYAELFDETLRRSNHKAVVTEYAWQTTSCDPCPTPPLSASDLATLGDEIVAPKNPDEDPQLVYLFGRKPPKHMFARKIFGRFGRGPSWVLTRLHTRYDRQTLSADLIFREADAVVGGRANGDGGLGDLGAQPQPGGTNNFQGRYVIRHYWEKPVMCKNPRYGVWGGPPAQGGGSGNSLLESAQDLANTERGKVSLPAVITSGLPDFGIPAKKRALRPNEQRP